MPRNYEGDCFVTLDRFGECHVHFRVDDEGVRFFTTLLLISANDDHAPFKERDVISDLTPKELEAVNNAAVDAYLTR